MSDLSRLNEVATPLAARARGGDAEAFGELVRQCYQQIHRWALVHTGDPDDADDVTQEVLIRLQRGIRRFRAQARFTTWLFQVTRNAALELHRKREARNRMHMRLQRDGHSDDDSGSTLEPSSESGISRLVKDFLTALPQRQREVFDLVDLQGLKPLEVSQMLDMNPATVRAHLFRARRALRSRILAQHPELAEGYHT